MKDIFQEQLDSMLELYEAAELAIADGRPDLLFAFSAFVRMTAFEDPQKVIESERKAAVAAGFKADDVDNGMAKIVAYHTMTGQFVPLERKEN